MLMVPALLLGAAESTFHCVFFDLFFGFLLLFFLFFFAGHVMLMGPALLLGAAEATAKLFSSDLKSSASWMSDFKTGTQIYLLYLL